MPKFGSRKDAPRVVGFDFTTPAAPPPPLPAAPEPWQPPVAEVVPEAVPVTTLAPPAPYAPPPAYAAVPYAATSTYAPPPPLQAPKPASPPWAKHTLRAVVALAAASASLKGVQVGLDKLRFHQLKTPQSIGGAPRMTTPLAQQMVDQMRTSMGDNLKGGVVAAYGTRLPDYILVAGHPKEHNVDDAWAKFTTSASDGATLGPRRTFPGDIACAPMTMSRLTGGVCVWSSSRSGGAVVSFTIRDLAALASATGDARTAVGR